MLNFEQLNFIILELLSSQGIPLTDLASVTLLVGDMSQYGPINAEYIQHFGQNPPVRVCVQANQSIPLILSASGYRSKAGKGMCKSGFSKSK